MSCKTEIAYFNVKVLNENIMRLNIPMYNSMIMQIQKDRNKLLDNILFLPIS